MQFVLVTSFEDITGSLSYPILPAHVLQDVAYEDWAIHPFHTAAHSYTITLQEATTTPTITATAAPVNSFIDQYSIYLIAAAVAIVIVVITVLVVRQRSKHK